MIQKLRGEGANDADAHADDDDKDDDNDSDNPTVTRRLSGLGETGPLIRLGDLLIAKGGVSLCYPFIQSHDSC